MASKLEGETLHAYTVLVGHLSHLFVCFTEGSNKVVLRRQFATSGDNGIVDFSGKISFLGSPVLVDVRLADR